MEPNPTNPTGPRPRDNGVRAEVTTRRADEGERALGPPPPGVDLEWLKQSALEAKAWLEERKLVTAALGFGLGFVLGRLLRRTN